VQVFSSPIPILIIWAILAACTPATGLQNDSIFGHVLLKRRNKKNLRVWFAFVTSLATMASK
jgi:hypothetical protein